MKYIVVTKQADSVLITNQKVIGVYTQTGDKTKPSSFFIEKGKINYVDIFVDFNNLPPQPF